MNVWRIIRGDSARRVLAGAVVGACVLIASSVPVFATEFICTAQTTAVVPGKNIFIRCDPGDGEIRFFALSVTHPDASRVLSLCVTAVAAGRRILIVYDPNDLSGTGIACSNANCRLIQQVELFRD